MVRSPVKVMTLAEFLLLPETKPANEFIDGQIIQKPMPQGKHSLIQGQLVINLEAKLKPQKIARAYPELRCSFGGRSTIPDVTVFTSKRIPRDEMAILQMYLRFSQREASPTHQIGQLKFSPRVSASQKVA
jgi:Uma2 family endonuclease